MSFLSASLPSIDLSATYTRFGASEYSYTAPLKPGLESLEKQAYFWLSCGHITLNFSCSGACVPARISVWQRRGRNPNNTPGWWWEDMPCRRPGSFFVSGKCPRRNGRFQRRVHRQHRLLKVPAERAGPPFMQHITGTVQRTAELILAVIVRAKVCYQPSDCRTFLSG